MKPSFVQKFNLLAVAQGLYITLAQFLADRFAGRVVTISYPEKKLKMKERFRGLHRLERYESGEHKGLEKCIGCALCAAACPADVITVVAGENDPANPLSPGERHAVVYDMDILRCIFCGMCTEACPTEAIVMKHDYELADDERGGPQGGENKFIYRKEDLLGREFYW